MSSPRELGSLAVHRDPDRTAELDAFIGFAAGVLAMLLVTLLLAGLAAVVSVGPGLRQVGCGVIAVAGLVGTVGTYLRLRAR
ncbi:hypothetical protein F4556_004371 [Kitasatospora gansuensis]|uniref:Uncharacterized protein n=1 Tax=Kitasatospora gansuensis TaxID=258050 RepID=A0A7W7SGF5_9ACTN|nr:hypothetical protein [Kitasatospora gansuensis]MBB4948836.1 hypothetical protein [Kitasatospora gansuensis]